MKLLDPLNEALLEEHISLPACVRYLEGQLLLLTPIEIYQLVDELRRLDLPSPQNLKQRR